MLTRIRLVLAAIVLIGLGAFLAVRGVTIRTHMTKTTDIKDIKIKEAKVDDWLKGTTDEVLDYYCNEYTEKNGNKTENYRWYVVYFESKDMPEAAGGGYIGVKVPKKEFDKYEKLKKAGADQYELTYQGQLKKCEGDVLKYKKEAQKAWENEIKKESGTVVDLSDYFLSYYIDLTSTKEGTTFLIGGIAMIAIGLICGLIVFFGVRNKKKQEAEAAALYAQQMQDLQNQQTPSTVYSPFGNAPDPSANVGAAAGFNLQGEKDELTQILEAEDQKVSTYNFENNLTGSNRVEDDH
ncbi:MAG: hypothetical protein IKX54_05920 [Lachnospiraceae bacterium]|nr:hypothetical protein [Lachnospiraceae bacterium]